jgi:phosphotransferase system HPr-like phosphotransfer protein
MRGKKNMKELLVDLNSIQKVKDFVNAIAKFSDDDVSFELASGRYIVDAKSILGVFSLDLSKPVALTIKETKPGTMYDVLEAIKDFTI